MRELRLRTSAVLLFVAVLAAFIGIAFGLGFLVGKLIL